MDLIDYQTNEQLSDRQQVALAALVKEPSVRAAAKACGLSEASIYRWKKHDSAFSQALKAARWAALEDSRKRLEQRVDVATDTLVAVCLDDKASASARVAAARSLWSIASRNYDYDDVLETLEELKDDATDTY
jgi:hypothetical protein